MAEKIGLICEGGGTKAAYTCGVLQCFLDYDIEFPYTVGISAGAEVLLPFVAKQKDRLRVTGVDAACESGAIGVSPLVHEKACSESAMYVNLLRSMHPWTMKLL